MDFAWNPIQNRVYVANVDGSSISVLRDSAGGVEESFEPQTAGRRREATIVRGVLVLGAAGGRQNTEYRADLLDVSGRKVFDLSLGANGVSRLAPGVYFVRGPETGDGKPDAAVTKVVIAK